MKPAHDTLRIAVCCALLFSNIALGDVPPSDGSLEEQRTKQARDNEAQAKNQQREQELRLEREAEARRRTILDEQRKLSEAARERAETDARKRREAEEAAARARELEAWKSRIHDRIKSKLVLPPGVPDSARAEYSMTMIPGGEVLSVKLRKSSGYPAYDAAIERAINAAAPLPVPSDSVLFQQLREVNLVFRPGSDGLGTATSGQLSASDGGAPRLEPRPEAVLRAEPVDEEAVDRFALEVLSRVGKLVHERGERAYPRLARERKWEGTAQIKVEFGANGQVKSIAVAETSGHALLDQRAMEMVREVLPNVPRELRSREFTVRIPIVFALKGQPADEARAARKDEHEVVPGESDSRSTFDSRPATAPQAQPELSAIQTPEQIAKVAFQGTVLLVMHDATGQPVALGSGFFVRKGEVATNMHVVEGASGGFAKVFGKDEKHRIEGVVGADNARDLVVLKVASLEGAPLRLGDSDAVQVGEAIYAVGNPQGLEGTFSEGNVSSVRQFEGTKLLQITAAISPGSSGGPVLNTRGQVVGVAVGTFKGGQSLNFAIPSNYLRNLLTSTGSARPLSTLPTRSHGSSSSGMGNRTSDGVVGGQFAWGENSFGSMTYSFSLRNTLPRSITNVRCAVVFYDAAGAMIEADLIEYREVIPAGLARRVKDSVDPSVRKLAGRYEFRILDFEMLD